MSVPSRSARFSGWGRRQAHAQVKDMVGVAHTGKKSGAGSGEGEWWGSACAGRPARVSERRPGGPASVGGGGQPGRRKSGRAGPEPGAEVREEQPGGRAARVGMAESLFRG